MSDKSIADIVAALRGVRQQKSALEKTEKALVAELKPLVDPEFDTYADLGIPANEFVIHAGKLDLFRIMGTSRTIGSDLLLERGVSPEIIAYSTKVTTYFQYRVAEPKEGQASG